MIVHLSPETHLFLFLFLLLFGFFLCLLLLVFLFSVLLRLLLLRRRNEIGFSVSTVACIRQLKRSQTYLLVLLVFLGRSFGLLLVG